MIRAAILVVALAACGGGSGARVGPAAPVKRAPVKRDALREFDAGLRALRLGGPEAHERAAERFEAAVEIDDTLWEAWYNLGLVYARVGDDGAALAALDEASARNRQYAPIYLARAEAARKLRRWDAARKDYARALELDPDDATTRIRLASLQRESGDLDGCLKTLREALRRSGQDARVYVELGLMYLAAGRDELAELVLRKASEMDAKNPLVWNALALLMLKRGKDQEAFLLFDQATSLDPSFRDARFNKAAVLMDAGDYKRAVTELEAVVAGDSEDLDARLALGVAYRGAGEYDRAAEAWKLVLRSAPKNADAAWNLAVLFMDFQKNEAQAREWLARFVQIAPGDHPKLADAKARQGELGGGNEK